MKTIFYSLLILAACSCGQGNNESVPTLENEVENQISETPVVQSETENDVPEAGSQKAMLIGTWQDVADATLTIEISADKYCTYINGKKNWDNPWDLCNYVDYAPESEDDNGKFLLVHLADKSSVFYGQEIVSLTQNELVVNIVKSSAGSGMTQTFIRI